MDKINVNFEENFRKNLKDSLNTYRNSPKGHVFIHETNKKTGEKKLLVEKDNLIVYRGRAWALLRAFNWTHVGNKRPTWKDYYISLFAVGSGGTITGSPLNPEVVRPSDYILHDFVDIRGNALATYYDFNGNYYRKIESTDIIFYHDNELATGNPEEYSLLPNTGNDHIQEGSGDSYPGDSFLVSKVTLTLEQEEANGDDDIQYISEAGLYASDLVVSGGSTLAVRPALFARVTFPTIVKTADRDITFSWYVYF